MIVQKNVNNSDINQMKDFQDEIKSLAEKYNVGCFYSAFKKTEAKSDEDSENDMLSIGGVYFRNKSMDYIWDALMKCFGTSLDCIFDYIKTNNYNIALFFTKMVEVVSEVSFNTVANNLEKDRILREKYGPLAELFAKLGIDDSDLLN